MDLKEAILSATVGNGTSKKNDKPYTFVDIIFKAENGTMIRKRVFLQDYEKPLLNVPA